MTMSDQALWLELTYLTEAREAPLEGLDGSTRVRLHSELLDEVERRYDADARSRVATYVTARSATTADLRRTILEDWNEFSRLLVPTQAAAS